jgi:WD40 repeat protein
LLQLDLSSNSRSQAAWHPDGGSLLAAPGTDNDIVLYERMSWELAFSLTGQHSAAISLLAFSKNGEIHCRLRGL